MELAQVYVKATFRLYITRFLNTNGLSSSKVMLKHWNLFYTETVLSVTEDSVRCLSVHSVCADITISPIDCVNILY